MSLGVAFFLIPLYPAFIALTGAPVPGVSLLSRPATFAMLGLVVVTVLIWTLALTTSPKRPIPTLLPLAAFPAAGVVAAVLGFDAIAGALFIAILLFGVIIHAAVVRFFREPWVAGAIFWSYLASGAMASFAAIGMVLAKMPSALYTIGHGRAIGTFVLPGELAGYLIVYVPVAFAIARTGASSRMRALAWTGLAFASVAFVMTFSRAGWFGMAAAIATYVLVRRGMQRAVYAIAVVAAAVIAVALVFNAHHDPSENFTRLSIWQAALAMMQRFPFTGVGPFEFEHLYGFVRTPDSEPVAYHAHSVVLTIAAETGLVGLSAVFFGWWRFIVELHTRLQPATVSAAVPVALAAGLAGTWVQGAIDTVTIVIFGLWLPMMGLAIAAADAGHRTSRDDTPAVAIDRSERRRPQKRTRIAPAPVIAIAAFAALAAFVQLASSALFSKAGAPVSVAAHLPPPIGERMYAAIEHIAPAPFVEDMLAEAALRRGDLTAAASHAARVPAGTVRSDLLARVAVARGDIPDAIRFFLDAGDDEALQPFVAQALRRGRIRDAYDLEARIRNRLTETVTRPNALADSCWRLARLAVRLGDVADASAEYDRAIVMAPLNTKYLIDAGTLALERHDVTVATSRFERANDIDPADADAVAGIGLALLQRNDVTKAAQRAARADALDPRSTLARRLHDELRTRSAKPAS